MRNLKGSAYRPPGQLTVILAFAATCVVMEFILVRAFHWRVIQAVRVAPALTLALFTVGLFVHVIVLALRTRKP